MKKNTIETVENWNIITSAQFDDDPDWLVHVWGVENFHGYWKDAVKYAKAIYSVVRTDKRRGRIWVKVNDESYYEAMHKIKKDIDVFSIYPVA